MKQVNFPVFELPKATIVADAGGTNVVGTVADSSFSVKTRYHKASSFRRTATGLSHARALSLHSLIVLPISADRLTSR
jgi:hypothetical protein